MGRFPRRLLAAVLASTLTFFLEASARAHGLEQGVGEALSTVEQAKASAPKVSPETLKSVDDALAKAAGLLRLAPGLKAESESDPEGACRLKEAGYEPKAVQKQIQLVSRLLDGAMHNPRAKDTHQAARAILKSHAAAVHPPASPCREFLSRAGVDAVIDGALKIVELSDGLKSR